MKQSACILDNSDLEFEVDEEEWEINGVWDKVVSDIKKEIHSLVGTCYTTLW